MSKEVIKNISLLFLFVLLAIFFALWYSKSPDNLAANKALQLEINKIQKQRDSLASDIKILEEKQFLLQDSIKNREAKIADITLKLKENEIKLDQANKNIQLAAANYNAILRKLTEAQKHPSLKEGDALLESLKNKLK